MTSTAELPEPVEATAKFLVSVIDYLSAKAEEPGLTSKQRSRYDDEVETFIAGTQHMLATSRAIQHCPRTLCYSCDNVATKVVHVNLKWFVVCAKHG